MKSQTQFNWIFIIVAGAIILTFFVNFAFKFKSFQEEKLSIELLINFDNALTNLQASLFNTFDIIEIPKDVEITCNEFRIEDKNYDNNKLIFSPNILKDKIYIYYKQFNFPFNVENLYYIISPGNRFYLIVNDAESREYAESLIEDLPEKFRENIQIKATRQLTGKNIFINQNSANDANIILQDNKVSIYYNNKLYDDVNKELVYGIIFSENFECNYNKLKSSLEKTVDVYQNKVFLLQNSNCNYASFPQYLQRLKEMKYQDVNAVETLNKNLASQNCPTLY